MFPNQLGVVEFYANILQKSPKTVQARLGHSSIVMTLDVYGHLFPSHDDGKELGAAERALFAT